MSLHLSKFLKRATLVLILQCGCLPVFAQGRSVSATANFDESVDQLRELQKLDQRVADIGWRLAVRNLELCPVHYAATGISLHTASQYAANWRAAASKAFGFSSGNPSVLAIAHESPAWAAGVRPNDMLVSINGELVDGSAQGIIAPKGEYAQTDRAMAAIESLPSGQTLTLVLERDGKQKAVSLKPAEACASRFEIATGNQLNANSNGSVVQLFGRLVVALDNDDDLALVAAHELAHNILGHNQEIRRRHLDTGLSAIFSKSGKVLRGFELDADRYGIFLSARAGFPYHHAAKFWRDFAATGGIGAWIPGTHPSPAARQRNAQATVDEIDAIVAKNAALIPARK